jgi:hypothetical protein
MENTGGDKNSLGKEGAPPIKKIHPRIRNTKPRTSSTIPTTSLPFNVTTALSLVPILNT